MRVTDEMTAALDDHMQMRHGVALGEKAARIALEAALAQQAGAVATGEVRAMTVNAGHGMNITQYVIDLGCDMDHNPIGRNMVGSRFALFPIASSAPGGGGEAQPFVTCRCHDERAKELCLDKHRCVRVSAHDLSLKEQV